MIRMLLDNAAFSAYLAAATSVLSFAALFIFFAGVPVFGPINDGLTVIQMLALIPTFVALAFVLEPQANGPVRLLAMLAAASALSIAVMQMLLVLRLVAFETTLTPILLLGVVLGAWWLLSAAMSLGHPELPFGLTVAGLLTGISFLVIAVGFMRWGYDHPLTAIGFVVGGIALPVWAAWFGRLHNSGRITLVY